MTTAAQTVDAVVAKRARQMLFLMNPEQAISSEDLEGLPSVAFSMKAERSKVLLWANRPTTPPVAACRMLLNILPAASNDSPRNLDIQSTLQRRLPQCTMTELFALAHFIIKQNRCDGMAQKIVTILDSRACPVDSLVRLLKATAPRYGEVAEQLITMLSHREYDVDAFFSLFDDVANDGVRAAIVVVLAGEAACTTVRLLRLMELVAADQPKTLSVLVAAVQGYTTYREEVEELGRA
jgi:hypothetical protein